MLHGAWEQSRAAGEERFLPRVLKFAASCCADSASSHRARRVPFRVHRQSWSRGCTEDAHSLAPSRQRRSPVEPFVVAVADRSEPFTREQQQQQRRRLELVEVSLPPTPDQLCDSPSPAEDSARRRPLDRHQQQQRRRWPARKCGAGSSRTTGPVCARRSGRTGQWLESVWKSARSRPSRLAAGATGS